MFQKATKTGNKVRMAIQGPSGSGKTFSALEIAKHLGKRIAVIDTEHRSASKYADRFDFDTAPLDPPYHPDRYIELIQTATEYDVLIIDSLSHAWNGEGGLLEIVDQIAKRLKTSNTFAAWKDATPIQTRLINALLRCPAHLIVTMRAKTEYVLEEVERNGRTINVPKKIGMAAVQRDGLEYEFDVLGEMTLDHEMLITKSRCFDLADKVIQKPGKEVADTLRVWLGDADPLILVPQNLLDRYSALKAEAEAAGYPDALDLTPDMDAEAVKTKGAAIRAWLDAHKEPT